MDKEGQELSHTGQTRTSAISFGVTSAASPTVHLIAPGVAPTDDYPGTNAEPEAGPWPSRPRAYPISRPP